MQKEGKGLPPPKKRQAKQARSKATVKVIIDAAAQVIADEGYERATTNRIADAAGVSVGSIYHYFSNKNEIFDLLIQQETKKTLSILSGLKPTANQSLETTLRSILESLITAQPRLPILYKQLELAPNALLQMRITEKRSEVIAILRAFLESKKETLKVNDLELAARLIAYSTEGIAARMNKDDYGVKLASEMAQMYSKYLRS